MNHLKEVTTSLKKNPFFSGEAHEAESIIVSYNGPIDKDFLELEEEYKADVLRLILK
jgi:hypothetical protein